MRCEVDVWLQRFSRAAIANVGRSFCIAGRPRELAAVIGRVCTTSIRTAGKTEDNAKVCMYLFSDSIDKLVLFIEIIRGG